MYLSYWGLRSSPFLSGDRAAFYAAPQHAAARRKLRYALDAQLPASLLLGDSGTGKTFLIQMLQRETEDRFDWIWLPIPQFSAEEFLAEIVQRLAPAADGFASATPPFFRIEAALRAAEGQIPRPQVLVVDEAQFIDDPQVFSILQGLLNVQAASAGRLNLLVVGTPPLAGRLTRAPAFDQRLAMRCILTDLDRSQTEDYVRFKLAAAGSQTQPFDASACAALYERTLGNPRRLDQTADFCLLVGCAEERAAISAETVHAVADDLMGERAAA